jgi:hypothetical protein
MQPLLGDLPLAGQTAAIPHRGPQRLDRPSLDATALALPGQVGKRGAVAIIGREPAGPELGAAAVVCEGANSRTDPGKRRDSSPTQAWCSAPEVSTANTPAGACWDRTSGSSSSNPDRSTGNVLGCPPVLSQIRCATLPGSTATTSVEPGNASCNNPTTAAFCPA